jgi:hypothetical protein
MAMLPPISAQSKEYVKVPVTARDSGGIINPITGSNAFAFLAPEATPAGGTTWTSGDWETVTQTGSGAPIYKARCLIGPGGSIQLVVGSYDVWLRITYQTETVMRKVGSLRII